MHQILLDKDNRYDELDNWLNDKNAFIVCGAAFENNKFLKSLFGKHEGMHYFSDFSPNPTYESVVKGIDKFRKCQANAIVAIGGGSAIDVAKCIKLFSGMRSDVDYLHQVILANNIPFLAIPTTAGTGSESTRYAVIYYGGEKQSITSEFCMPDYILLDPVYLESLPKYQRKATMMDTFAHSIESMWSVNSNNISMQYSAEALELFLRHKDGYLQNRLEDNEGMLRAANMAGKAINISQTTAGHAMSYKITSLFGVAHGHAAMMCNRKVFPWMLKNESQIIDEHAMMVLTNAISCMRDVFGCSDAWQVAKIIENEFEAQKLEIPVPSKKQLATMIMSVNKERLRNSPIELNKKNIDILYRQIFCIE